MEKNKVGLLIGFCLQASLTVQAAYLSTARLYQSGGSAGFAQTLSRFIESQTQRPAAASHHAALARDLIKKVTEAQQSHARSDAERNSLSAVAAALQEVRANALHLGRRTVDVPRVLWLNTLDRLADLHRGAQHPQRAQRQAMQAPMRAQRPIVRQPQQAQEQGIMQRAQAQRLLGRQQRGARGSFLERARQRQRYRQAPRRVAPAPAAPAAVPAAPATDVVSAEVTRVLHRGLPVERVRALITAQEGDDPITLDAIGALDQAVVLSNGTAVVNLTTVREIIRDADQEGLEILDPYTRAPLPADLVQYVENH